MNKLLLVCVLMLMQGCITARLQRVCDLDGRRDGCVNQMVGEFHLFDYRWGNNYVKKSDRSWTAGQN